MATTDEDDDPYYSIEIDWCSCPLLESIPGKCSGAWVIEGTRMPAQVVIDNYDSCMDPPEIADAYEVDLRLVEAIVDFAEDYRAEARARLLASPGFAALLDAAPAPLPPVDWSDCPGVEWMAGSMHDTWVLRGTPTPADMLMRHHDDGWRLEDIVEQYGWAEASIAALIAFGEAQRAGIGNAAKGDARAIT
jgi:uncharacterized protein (DUF433 family)